MHTRTRIRTEPKQGRRTLTIPAVTAVVVSYNCSFYLQRTLQALRTQRGVELQVVVVDNASSDGSPAMVRRDFPEVELLASSRNQGLAGGANRGIERARHPLVCTMNADLELEPDALAIIARYVTRHPEVGAVGPQLRNTDGSLQPAGKPLPRLTDVIAARYHLPHAGPEERGRDFDRDRPVGVIPGACLMVTRQVLDDVGGYDEERFFLNWEDVDWCHRIAAAGYGVHYVGGARAIHHLGVSQATNSAMASLTGRSGALRYIRRHHGLWAEWLLAAALLPGDALSLLLQSALALVSRGRRGRRNLAWSILAVTWRDASRLHDRQPA
jgi:GT2 family glycosyltransferase